MNKQLRNALKGLISPDINRRRRAMEPFVRATFEVFIRHLYQYLGNEVECEDILEDVYADIWENPNPLCNVTNEKQLLRTVYLDYMRKRLTERYKGRERHLYLLQENLKKLIAPEIDVLYKMSQLELKQALQRALSKLKPREGKAIELWMTGMTNRAIANELKTTIGSVKTLEYRTMLKLKKLLSDYCRED